MNQPGCFEKGKGESYSRSLAEGYLRSLQSCDGHARQHHHMWEGYKQVNCVLAEITVLKNCTIYFFEQRSQKIVFQLLPKQLNLLHSIP